jgi:hypothetical protein
MALQGWLEPQAYGLDFGEFGHLGG